MTTPKGEIKQLKDKLSSLKRARRFIRWGESAGLARELRNVLQQIEEQVDDPQIGCELVANFYTTDRSVFDRCDDSSGHVGDVYRFDAQELFLSYASRYADKNQLAKLVLKTSLKDDYGVRDALVNSAAEFLLEEQLRWLIEQFQKLANTESDEFARRHWHYQVESLARQLKDPQLFEKTRLAAWGTDLPTAGKIDIAEAYLESGDEHTALSWLEKISETENYQREKQDKLLLTIYGRLGDSEKQREVACRSFRRQRSRLLFEEWLVIAGHDQNSTFLAEEIQVILNTPLLSLTDAAFLTDMEQYDAAESYLQARAEQLNGDYYQHLLPLAETFESLSRPLTASLLYRALLDSILHRGQTKTYGHGARYLHKLDLLAKTVSDWKEMKPHAEYAAKIKQTHGRKTSFWARYEKL
ncbi:MAG: hypothetical protein C0622_06015 [Desulfuromonas sp.]|nr:MAG: hypothetical protein C0622_06015 [Desulfuromonas sp.]